MSSTNIEDFSEIDFVRAAESAPSPHQQWAHSGLRAGASPEQRTDGDLQGCRNACGRDDNPVDCKTLSVRRRLAEDLGCCGCTGAPETPCLVTDEDASTCCQQRRPETNGSAARGAVVDPVQQIIEEGLQRQNKRHHGRRQSSSRSGRPRRGPELHGGQPRSDRRGGYQPDYFDDQADMNNWQQHRDQSRRDEPRQRPSSPPPRPRSLAFEPYVDTEPYSPARPSTPGGAPVRPQRQNENPEDLRRDMLLELQRLDEQRAELLQSMERERKMVEMVLEHQRKKRGSCPAPAAAAAGPCDDRQRIQRRIDEAKQKTAELQRRYQQQQQQQQPSSSSDGQCAPAISSAATGCPSTGQRRKLHYQPPSPDTDDECCAPPPPPQRRLLKYNPPSSDSSDDDCGNAAGGGSRSAAGDDRPSSLQDSSVYYNRSSRNGVPPVTADVPQQTSSLWTNP